MVSCKVDIKSDSSKIDEFTEGLEDLFSAKDTKAPKQDSEAKPKPPKTEGVVLIKDSRRAQNLTIALSKLKIQPDEFKNAFERADLDLITEARVEIMTRCLPDALEQAELDAFKATGDLTKLRRMEQILLGIMGVPRVRFKLTTLTVYYNVGNLVHGCRNDVAVLVKVCPR